MFRIQNVLSHLIIASSPKLFSVRYLKWECTLTVACCRWWLCAGLTGSCRWTTVSKWLRLCAGAWEVFVMVQMWRNPLLDSRPWLSLTPLLRVCPTSAHSQVYFPRDAVRIHPVHAAIFHFTSQESPPPLPNNTPPYTPLLHPLALVWCLNGWNRNVPLQAE